MPILILFLNIVIGEALTVTPIAVTLGVTAAVSDDTAMDHYLAEVDK